MLCVCWTGIRTIVDVFTCEQVKTRSFSINDTRMYFYKALKQTSMSIRPPRRADLLQCWASLIPPPVSFVFHLLLCFVLLADCLPLCSRLYHFFLIIFSLSHIKHSGCRNISNWDTTSPTMQLTHTHTHTNLALFLLYSLSLLCVSISLQPLSDTIQMSLRPPAICPRPILSPRLPLPSAYLFRSLCWFHCFLPVLQSDFISMHHCPSSQWRHDFQEWVRLTLWGRRHRRWTSRAFHAITFPL